MNGVAFVHTELIKKTMFKNFYQMYPKKFKNMTNGVTPRRWIVCANRELAQLYNEYCPDHWMLDLQNTLPQLESEIDNKAF